MKTVEVLKKKNGVASKIRFNGNDYALIEPINRPGKKKKGDNKNDY